MKNTGRMLFLILALVFAMPLHAAEISTGISDNTIAAGDSTELTITITGASGVQVPDPPQVNGLRIIYGGRGSSFQYFNGRSSSSVTLTFHVLGEKEGNYKITSFPVVTEEGVLYTREVNISVAEGLSHTMNNGLYGEVLCDAEFSSGSVYSGQPLVMRYFLYHDEGAGFQVLGMSEPPVTKGFIVKEISEEISPVTAVKNGRSFVKRHYKSWCLIPELSGSHETGGGSIVIQQFTSRSRLSFPLKKISVRPVPVKGKPAGFSGDTGEFRIEAGSVSGPFKVNEEIRIPVTVSGKGNFLLMSKPVFENTDGLRIIFDENEPELSLNGNIITGTKKYTVTVIPQKEGSISPGRISLAYFNPDTGAYESASSEPYTFNVSGILTPQEIADTKDQGEKGSPGYAYIIAGVLLMAAFSGALYIIIRERRRYAGLKIEAKGPSIQEEVKADPVKLLRDEFEAAHGSGDSERLMKLFARAMDMVCETPGGKNSPETAAVKVKLDAARYANAALSADEMEEVYGFILHMLKQLQVL